MTHKVLLKNKYKYVETVIIETARIHPAFLKYLAVTFARSFKRIIFLRFCSLGTLERVTRDVDRSSCSKP